MTETGYIVPDASSSPHFIKKRSPLLEFVIGIWKNGKGKVGMIIYAVMIGIAVFGRLFAPYSPTDVNFPAFQPPSLAHLLGTNYVGEDVFSEFLYGTGVSLTVGFVVAFATMVIGTIAGISAGFLGKVTDDVIMRTVDVLLVIPGFPLLVILSAYLPPTIWSTILILSILSWPFHARVIRSQTLTLKRRAFVLASKLSGLGNFRIIVRDLIPNMLPIIFINSIFVVVGAIVAQAGLAFFGLGNINSVNWGTMLYWFDIEDGILFKAWWWLLPPGLGIMALGIGANLLSNAVSETNGTKRKD
jgi:peptide/nickel transport system permease protein